VIDERFVPLGRTVELCLYQELPLADLADCVHLRGRAKCILRLHPLVLQQKVLVVHVENTFIKVNRRQRLQCLDTMHRIQEAGNSAKGADLLQLVLRLGRKLHVVKRMTQLDHLQKLAWLVVSTRLLLLGHQFEIVDVDNLLLIEDSLAELLGEGVQDHIKNCLLALVDNFASSKYDIGDKLREDSTLEVGDFLGHRQVINRLAHKPIDELDAPDVRVAKLMSFIGAIRFVKSPKKASHVHALFLVAQLLDLVERGVHELEGLPAVCELNLVELQRFELNLHVLLMWLFSEFKLHLLESFEDIRNRLLDLKCAHQPVHFVQAVGVGLKAEGAD